MKCLWKPDSDSTAARLAIVAALAAALLLGPGMGAASEPVKKPPQDAPDTQAAKGIAEDGQQSEAGDVEETPDPAEVWGIEISSIRLTANDHMIDFRYRVVDPAKASELFVRQNKPAMIHRETGKVLTVPETAKTGPLRNSNNPQQGRIYWMFFGNAGFLVKSGDRVSIVIGDFRVDNLVVE